MASTENRLISIYKKRIKIEDKVDTLERRDSPEAKKLWKEYDSLGREAIKLLKQQEKEHSHVDNDLKEFAKLCLRKNTLAVAGTPKAIHDIVSKHLKTDWRYYVDKNVSGTKRMKIVLQHKNLPEVQQIALQKKIENDLKKNRIQFVKTSFSWGSAPTGPLGMTEENMVFKVVYKG